MINFGLIKGNASKEYVDNVVTKHIFFPVNPAGTNDAEHRTRNTGGTGQWRMEMFIPFNFNSLIYCKAAAIISAGAIGIDKDIDLYSSYGTDNEPMDNHAESNTTITFDFSTYTADDIVEIDVSSVLSNLASGDYVGIRLDLKGIGGALNFLGLVLRYT